MNTRTASGQRLAHLARPLDVDLEHDPARRALELASSVP